MLKYLYKQKGIKMNIKGHISTSLVLFIPLVELYNKTLEFLTNKSILEINSLSNLGIFNNNINVITILVFYIVYFIGERIPDLDLKLKIIFKNKEQYHYHRQLTHSLLIDISIIVLGIYLENIYVSLIGLGILSHLIADMITGSIPLFLYGKYYNSFVRIGISKKVVGENLYSFFTKELPKFFDLIFIPMIILGVYIIYNNFNIIGY